MAGIVTTEAPRQVVIEHARLIATIMDLQADGTLDLSALVSRVLPFDDASEAFRLLDEAPDEALQVVLVTEAASDEAPHLPNGGER